MHIRKALAASALAIGLTLVALSGAAAANAEPPVALGSGHVVDDAGVLAGDASAIESAATTLQNDHHVRLYVVFVNKFESPSDPRGWATTTASQNGLTPTDYLLAVSVGGRSYYLSASAAGPLSKSQLTSIEQNQIEPELRKNNWSGAGVAAANGIGSAMSGGASNTAPGSVSGASSGGIVTAVVVSLLIVMILIVGSIVFVFVRAARRRRDPVPGSVSAAAVPATPVDELQAMPLADLERRAASALVATDDALQASAQELGFAQAEYGDQPAQPFSDAVDAAKARLSEAFSLKQKLDDEVPDTKQERREWNAKIVQLCAEANRLHEEQTRNFADLRALEKNVPQKVESLRSAIASVQQRLVASQTTLAQLTSAYSDAALLTVHDNGPHATERLTFANAALDDAEAKNSGGSVGEAAVSLRAAEAAVGQANLLLDAVDRVASDLANARGHIDDLMTDLQRDIVDARALAAAGDPSGAIMIAQQSSQDAVDAVTARLNAGRIDPRELIQRLELANRDIDGVLGAVRARNVQEERASASLGQVLAGAQARITAATDFIAARRGAVGAEARTRLAEASHQLSVAQSTASTDVVSALAAGRRADDLAAEATQLAGNDVSGFATNTGGGMFGLPGQVGGGWGGGGRFGGGGIIGAVLGGILFGSVLGGGDNDGGGPFGGGGNGGDFFSGGFGGGDNRDAGGGGFFGGDAGGGGSFGGDGGGGDGGGGGSF